MKMHINWIYCSSRWRRTFYTNMLFQKDPWFTWTYARCYLSLKFQELVYFSSPRPELWSQSCTAGPRALLVVQEGHLAHWNERLWAVNSCLAAHYSLAVLLKGMQVNSNVQKSIILKSWQKFTLTFGYLVLISCVTLAVTRLHFKIKLQLEVNTEASFWGGQS